MATAPLAAPPSNIALDSDQQKAAAHVYGTAAVAAAAGSGKTTLLVGRAVSLVEAGIDARSIMTLAFNRNAAITLRERFQRHPATAEHAQGMASTFHAFAYSMCRLVLPNLRVLGQSAEQDAGQRPGRNEQPQRTARDLSKDVWANMGGTLRGSDKPQRLRGVDLDDLYALEPGVRERLFSAGWPNLAKDPAAVAKVIDGLDVDLKGVPPDVLADFMVGFRTARQQSGAVDFTDMLLGFAHYLRQGNPQVMTRFRQYRHLQIDESQDGNELRWFIAQTFANFGEARSVMAVGDLRQSIAGFAGAQPALFKAWWDKADAQFTLPRNYRSASAIVEAGNEVAHGEPWNIGGDSIAAREDLGPGLVRVGPVGSLAVAVEIATALNNGVYGHKDVTVLSRTRAALETIAFGLRAKGIRVAVRGGGNVWRSMDGRMVRAYLDLSERRVRDLPGAVMALNRPLRYVSRDKLTSWLTPDGQLSVKLRDDLRKHYRPAEAVVDAMEELAGLPWEARVDLVEQWLVESLEQDRETDDAAPGADSDKADLYRNLCSIARVCGSVENLDTAIAADTRVDPKDPDVVELSTIHQSKGDQWGTVYVTVAKGVFPSPRAKKPEELAEEVRLLYVAVTRPVHTLVVDMHGDDHGVFNQKLQALQAVAKASQDALVKDEPVAEPLPAPEAALAPVEPTPVETGSSHVTPVEAAERLSPKGLYVRMTQLEPHAKRSSEQGATPAPGERFVPVRWPEFIELLGAYFDEDTSRASRAGQRVMSATLTDGSKVLVYTSIPPNAREARGNGEDSIKVALLDPQGQPYSRKQPYAARTRNWRMTLVSRIKDVLEEHPRINA